MTLQLVSLPNDIWQTTAEIPYWWRVTTQIWVVTRHKYGISVLVSQTSFCGETSGSIAKCRLFSRLNCRIPYHLFACHWIRIASIVLCFVLQRTPTNENNGGTEWRGIQQLLRFLRLRNFIPNRIDKLFNIISVSCNACRDNKTISRSTNNVTVCLNNKLIVFS